MYTRVKTPLEISNLRQAGGILATVLAELSNVLVSGMSTKDLAEIAKSELRALGATPAFLGYEGFPDVLCVSVNDEVVHGIPRSGKVISAGDIVSMDFGVTYQGMVADAAVTVIAGKPIDSSHSTLVHDTELALEAGISVLKAGVHTGDIAAKVQNILDKGGYGIVRDLVGHGVGHQLHEEPNVPNYGSAGSGPALKAGMTIAIEPMATLGQHEVYVDSDGWTVKTVDQSLAAHFEHTVLITDTGFEILTGLPKQ